MKKQNIVYSVWKKQTKFYFAFVVLLFLFFGSIQPSQAEDTPSKGPRDQKIEALENAVKRFQIREEIDDD